MIESFLEFDFSFSDKLRKSDIGDAPYGHISDEEPCGLHAGGEDKIYAYEERVATEDCHQCLPLTHPEREQFVVYMAFVGHKGVAPGLDAMDKYPDHIEAGKHKGRERQYGRIHLFGKFSRIDIEDCEAEEGEYGADGEGAGVAHENFITFLCAAKHVVDEEWHQSAERSACKSGIEIMAGNHKKEGIEYHGDGCKARGESVDSIDKIYGIDYVDDYEPGEDVSHHGIDVVDKEESEKIAYSQTGSHYQDRRYYLHQEFDAVFHSGEVVGYSCHKHQQHGAEAENQLAEARGHGSLKRCFAKNECTPCHQTHSEGNGGEEGYSAEPRHNALMHLPVVVLVKKTPTKG